MSHGVRLTIVRTLAAARCAAHRIHARPRPVLVFTSGIDRTLVIIACELGTSFSIFSIKSQKSRLRPSSVRLAVAGGLIAISPDTIRLRFCAIIYAACATQRTSQAMAEHVLQHQTELVKLSQLVGDRLAREVGARLQERLE